MNELPVVGNDVNQCMMCRHLIQMGEPFHVGSRGWRCAAFKERDIPSPIVRGYFDHREQWVEGDGIDDNGIQFEDNPDAPVTYEQLMGPVDNDHLLPPAPANS